MEARFTRRLRVVTQPNRNHKMLKTRTLSELVFMSPRASPRITPRNRFDMDIEVGSTFLNGEGTVNWMGEMHPVSSTRTSLVDSLEAIEEMDHFQAITFSPSQHDKDTMAESEDKPAALEEPEMEQQGEGGEEEQENQLEAESSPVVSEEEEEEDNTHNSNGSKNHAPQNVAGVIDMLFEIHSALKTKHLGQRTAASALAASNLVTTVAFPKTETVSRDEEMEILENTRKMLECAICSDIFTNATESSCCGQVYCNDCIVRWVNEQSSCPMCRKDVTMDMLRPSRHTQRIANEMKVNCQYCEEVMKKIDVAAHLPKCAQAPVEPPAPQDVVVRNHLVNQSRINFAFFRRFLTTPLPPLAQTLQCYIRTHRGNYQLFTQDGNTLLCTAVRKRGYNLNFHFELYMATETLVLENEEEHSYDLTPLTHSVGRLERNYVGSQYTIRSTSSSNNNNNNNNNQNSNQISSQQQQQQGEEVVQEIGAIQYAATFGKTPRQMRVALPTVRLETETMEIGNEVVEGSTLSTERYAMVPLSSTGTDDTLLSQIERPDASRSLSLVNKPPVWIESLEAYCLDFGGRVSEASVKNFILAGSDNMEKTLMLFGRTTDRNVYAMDFCHPLSPVQAFAIALSSMDSHLVTFD